ncbi:epoxyqueuosine reductase QueH [candidate division FCPU426 bacterium]|nr:epoxyqueuosine reductase QueH [candidate division FCPU426 bacterium]
MTAREKVLLHICCAPDATAVFERLQAAFTVVGYFHNPNIQPLSEYQIRLEAAEKVAACMGFSLLVPEYRPQDWLQAVRGLEQEPERGRRCGLCFSFNLQAAAAKARELAIPWVTSTLTISPHKNAAAVIKAGQHAAQLHAVRFLERDFKKNDGFKRSLLLSRELHLYRQNYCGCLFSRPRSGDA